MRHDFFRKFNIDEDIAINFFSQVEAGYHCNPYHNQMHGADVLHIVHFILTPGGLRERAQLTDEDAFAALIAGMIHDYDHPGLNNNFHTKIQSYLATLYNDKSILENHHCAEVFELMKTDRFNLLHCLTEIQARDVRETIIEMVLSTDMGLHAKIFGAWKRRIATDQDLHKRKDDQRLTLSMAVKMADISNCGRPQHLYLKWGAKLSEEFFLQGDNERNRGDQVSPFMDRFAPSMAKSQIAFMNYVVIPMFESISEYLPNMHFSVDHCESNKTYWSSNDDSL
jgi:3',5'-cyclic-nucleotide phosphodiesterase